MSKLFPMEMDHQFRRLNIARPKNTSLGFVKWVLLILFLGFFFGGLIWFFNSSSSSTVAVFSKVFPANPLKSTNDRVNVLFLGNAGGRHDGPLLTDSIIVASYNLKTKKVTLIPVPRDLWIDSIKAKVNAVYEIGQKRSEGLKFAQDKLDDILGIPIHYGVRLDFNGFSKAIDLVGGVDVKVEKTFDDWEYPIEGKEDDLCDYKETEVEITEDQIKSLNFPSPLPSTSLFLPGPPTPGKKKVLIDISGKIATDSSELKFPCRYEHIHFDKGLQNMNGAIALIFVRSRMGTNGEGSDFARSKRQQLVIQAFRSKALSVETLTNPTKVLALLNTLGKSFETDIPKERFPDFYKLIKDVELISSIVLGDLGKGKSIFINPASNEYGAWVLIPPNNDFTPVKDLLHQVLE